MDEHGEPLEKATTHKSKLVILMREPHQYHNRVASCWRERERERERERDQIIL